MNAPQDKVQLTWTDLGALCPLQESLPEIRIGHTMTSKSDTDVDVVICGGTNV